MYLAVNFAWLVVGVAFALLLMWTLRAGVRVIRDRNRQGRDRMLPP